MALQGISLDRLQNFCLVAEKGGIAKAVGDDLSRQALFSRQIRELEEFFGVELTRRRGKGVEVTEAGMELARLARVSFEGLRDFRDRASQEPVDIRIAAGNSVMEWYLIPLLAKLGKALADTRVQLCDVRTAETVRALTEHTADIGVVRVSAVTAPLKCSFAAELGYRLFVPRKLEAHAQNLSALPLALSLGGEFQQRTMELAEKAKIALNIRWRCASFTEAARLIEHGVCAAILPEIAADYIRGNAIQVELPWLKSYRRRLAFAWHQRVAEARPAVAKLLELLKPSAKQ